MTLRLVVATLPLAVLVSGSAIGATEDVLVEEGRAAFAAVVGQVDSILADEKIEPRGKRAQIAYLLDQWLDLAFMTRAALGENAEKFSHEELADFSHEFGRYVVAIYLRRIARAEGKFEVLGAAWQERSRTVMVRTRGGRPLADRAAQFNRGRPGTAEVDYRLRKRRGEWRILTIVIDGADTVRLFHGQFEAALASQSPEEVIGRLREHNTSMDAENPFDG